MTEIQKVCLELVRYYMFPPNGMKLHVCLFVLYFGSWAAGHIYLQWQPKPWTFPWSLLITQATDIYTDPMCSRTLDLDMALNSSQDQELTMTSSYLLAPYHH